MFETQTEKGHHHCNPVEPCHCWICRTSCCHRWYGSRLPLCGVFRRRRLKLMEKDGAPSLLKLQIALKPVAVGGEAQQVCTVFVAPPPPRCPLGSTCCCSSMGGCCWICSSGDSWLQEKGRRRGLWPHHAEIN